MTLLEICAPSWTSAMAAQAGGADRIELCQNLEIGGITPSPAVLTLTRRSLSIPVAVLIRPRGGDFVYSADEQLIMHHDIVFCRDAGMDAVVVGGLTSQGDLDKDLCRRYMEWAYPMDVVFHRAIDKCRDPLQAIDQLITWGYHRVLTSGQAQNAPAGAELIKAMQHQAAGKLTIMAGGGLTADNISVFVARTQVSDVHLSAKKLIPSRFKTTSTVTLSIPGIPEDEYLETDTHSVQRIKRILTEL